MDRTKFLNVFWQYYLSLETDFLNSLRYVTLSKENYECYSIEYQRLLLAIGSEIDVCLKKLCGFESHEFTKINDYKRAVKTKELMTKDNEVTVRNKQIATVNPFYGWPERTPNWWKSYNDVKHGRSSNYRIANLKNVFKSLAALYLLNEYLYYQKIEEGMNGELPLQPESNLFSIEWKTGWVSAENLLIRKVGEVSD